MNSFRGIRCMTNIGVHGVKLCRLQQQRRFVSLALPAIAHALKKSSFQDVLVVPVNKFDLSGCGVISSTCPVMFSTSSDALAVDEPSSVETGDSDSVEESRWPSPVHQQTAEAYSRDNSIFAGGYNFDHNETSLSKLFSQFGEVTEITIPRLEIYNQIPSTSENYRFAFIEFKERESALKALQAGRLSTDLGRTVDIKERYEFSKKQIEQQRTFVLKNLPESFTVFKCIELFKEVGKLEMVNIVFNSMIQKYEGQTFAFLLFKEIPDMTKLQSISNTISNEVMIEPMKSVRKMQPRTRNKKVFVEKLPSDLPMDKLVDYFSSYGKVTFTKLFNPKEGSNFRSAIVEFTSIKEATDASQKTFQNIEGNDVVVRCLGWSAEM